MAEGTEDTAVKAFSEFADNTAKKIADELAGLPDQMRVSGIYNFICMLRREIQRNPETKPLTDIMTFAMDRADRIKDQQSYEAGFRAVEDQWAAIRMSR